MMPSNTGVAPCAVASAACRQPHRAGVTTLALCSLILAPFLTHLIHAGEFLEVYMAVPIEVCEQRDPKGLYKKVGGRGRRRCVWGWHGSLCWMS